MPIPELTDKGLLPEGIFECTFEEIEEKFAYNTGRKKLWDNFLAFLIEVRQTYKGKAIYVDGGFTSKKDLTSDIDVVLEYENTTPISIVMDLTNKREYFKKTYKVDAMPCLQTTPGKINDLRKYFQYIKQKDALRLKLSPKAKKGLLKVNI